MSAAESHLPHRSRDPFRRRRHAAVAAVARNRAEAVDAAARRRDAAREDRGARARAARCRGARHRHQPRVLLPHARTRTPGCAAELPERTSYLLEPFGRNTAPAVALAALWAQRASRRRRRAARAARRSPDSRPARVRGGGRAGGAARASRLAGHVRHRADASRDGLRLHRMRRRRLRATTAARSPHAASSRSRRSRRRAQYLAAGNYVWNSGMFCFTPAAILAAFARHAPASSTPCAAVAQRTGGQSDASMLEIDADAVRAVPDISLDYAVMEKAAADGEVAVVRGTFDWSDVGSWQAVADLHRAGCATATAGRASASRSPRADTYVHAGDRVVATVGVENLVIVDTPDAVLVAHRDHLQRVKDVVGELKARGHESYRLHKTVARPWGAYTVLRGRPGLQDQAHRGEARRGAVAAAPSSPQRALVVVAGIAQGDARRRDVSSSAPTARRYIPVETRHRLENPATDAAGDDRSPVRRLPRRGRHRPLRRQVRARAGQ